MKTTEERVTEINRDWWEQNKTQGFWKDMIDYYNDPDGIDRLPPRGCRCCPEKNKSWWCPLFDLGRAIGLFLEILKFVLKYWYSELKGAKQ